MEDPSNHTNDANLRFTLQPQIKWKLNLFKTFYLLSGFSMIYFILRFTSDSSNDELFVKMSLLSLLVMILTVIFAGILIRCPQCGKRVYTLTLMWKNKMPDRKQHYCPFCNFPGEKITNNINGG